MSKVVQETPASQPRSCRLRTILLSATIAFASITDFGSSEAVSDDFHTVNTARFTLSFGDDYSPSIRVKPSDLAAEALDELNGTYEELTSLFLHEPKRRVTLRFLSPKEFRRQTGAPSWTSAMYYRGEITVPLTERVLSQTDEFRRAIRHEYVHAVVAEISTSHCPAWLDEGAAMLIEGGKINPVLGPALRKWVAENDAMPLAWLQSGFTTLRAEFVPAAYAQSLFATRLLVEKHGFGAFKSYLDYLAKGSSQAQAFELAFGQREEDFETQLTRRMRTWAKSAQIDP